MKVVNLLDFLNRISVFNALKYASVGDVNLNLLDKLSDDDQFVQIIDLGIVYLQFSTLQNVVVIDGIQRLLSISLLLHAICECYKKTSKKNDSAIKYIREHYLLNNGKLKLRLPERYQIIYEKIINGERLSGKEKKSPLFILLHNMWSQIKENELQASEILNMLKKTTVVLVEVENISERDLYVTLNNEKRELDQFELIKDYLDKYGVLDKWNSLERIFNAKKGDINLYFKDFFATKFNFKKYNDSNLYNYFVNYFETMLTYLPANEIMVRLCETADLYYDIINVKFVDQDIKKAFIKLKMHNGEDTYAYLLNIYEDYLSKNITKTTFLEILSTIDEYLQNRINTPNEVSFNELIRYLNAFITCK